MTFIIFHLFQTHRRCVLTEYHIAGTGVTINNNDDLFVASEKRKSHQFFNASLKEPTVAFSKCSEYYHASDIPTLVPESTLFGISNHNTVRFRYFTLINVILKGVL